VAPGAPFSSVPPRRGRARQKRATKTDHRHANALAIFRINAQSGFAYCYQYVICHASFVLIDTSRTPASTEPIFDDGAVTAMRR
jgi:hypothetical protein